MTVRRMLVDDEVLLELGRDEALLDAVVGAVGRGELVVLTTPQQREDLEAVDADMACHALAGLERLPTTAATPEALAAVSVTVVTDEPDAGALGDAAMSVDAVWTLQDLRRHVTGR